MSVHIVIIPAGDRDAAITAGEMLLPELSQLQEFHAALSPTGELPATHYWCCGPMTAEQADTFCGVVPSAEAIAWDMYSDPAMREALLMDRGLQPYQEDTEP